MSSASLRPDVKLVLMSATINAEQFSQYFGESGWWVLVGVAVVLVGYWWGWLWC